MEEIADSVSEISGEKNFPCKSCEKICKQKAAWLDIEMPNIRAEQQRKNRMSHHQIFR